MVLVQPALQMVLLIFACVTFGLVAPGVIEWSGQVRPAAAASPTTDAADIRHNANTTVLMILSPIGRELLFAQVLAVPAPHRLHDVWTVRALVLRRNV